MSSIATHYRARTCLLLGGGPAALAAMLAAVPASAQSAGDHVVGTQVVISHQDAASAGTLAETSGIVIQAAPAATDHSQIVLNGNAVSAAASVNRAEAALVLAEDQSSAGLAPSLISGSTGILADGSALLIVSQRATRSPATARNLDGQIGLGAGSINFGNAEVAGNMIEAAAAGNDATVSLEASNIVNGTGAAIVGYQTGDAQSDRSAINAATVRLSADSATDSDLAMTGNLLRALGQGNAFSSEFSVDAAAVEAAAGAGPASFVPGSASGSPIVAATYAILSHQEQAGSVTAHLGLGDLSDRLAMTVRGTLSGSRTVHDGNALVASAYRNRSSNAMTLDIGAITSPSSDSAAVANITNLQRSGGSNVNAVSLGGIQTSVLGSVAGSELSLSDNEVGITSAANLAEGNLLSVRSATIDTATREAMPSVGTAATGSDGNSSVTGAFSVHNVQDFGDGKAGANAAGLFGVMVSDSVERTAITAQGNDANAAATGNAAHNSLEMSGALVRTSADLNNVQTGDGTVRASAGSLDSPIGMLVDLSAPVHASSLSVGANGLAATAVGNSAANMMAIDAVGLADGGGHAGAAAGIVADGYGAAATFALANNQKLGEREVAGGAVAISSMVAGRFGMSGDAAATETRITVEGNAQRAIAIGSTAANRLSATAAAFGDESAAVPGASLSSAQYGQVAASARSDMVLMTPASLKDSIASVSGNINLALAGINEVDNALVVEGANAGSLAGPDARAAVGTSVEVVGGHALANLQFAGGNVRAIANMTIGNGGGQSWVTGLSYSVEGNAVHAEASANRASNTVTIDSVTGMGGAAGLGSSQTSTATVSATVGIDAGFQVPGFTSGEPIEEFAFALNGNEASALAQGNVADNSLELSVAPGLSSATFTDIGRFDAQVRAGAPLLNAQTNYGTVGATASGTFDGGTLNGGMTASTAAYRGNGVSAGAHGNNATNRLAMTSRFGFAPAAVVSTQTNTGAVTAFASGALTMPVGAVSGSSITVSGNALSASAVGNQSVNTLIVNP